MQFKVPQFLDIEDKIFGPFTFSEFVYLAGGAGLCYVLFKLLGFFVGFVPILLVGGFSLALVFYRPNGKPFINMVENSISYYTQNRLYVWKRQDRSDNKNKQPINNAVLTENEHIVKLNKSKLKDLSWSLDVLDVKNKSEENI